MNRFSKQAGGPAACTAALLLAAALAVGCGSGDEPPAAESTAAQAPETADRSNDSEAQPHGARPETNAKARVHEERTSEEPGHDPNPQRAPVRRTGRDVGDAPQDAAAREAANACVERFGRATCAAMAARPTGPSTQVDRPQDCLEVMSKSECEEMLAAEQAARDHDESVNVEECIDHPTPHCEEVLRAIYGNR
jgi:hypothetical protein